MQDTITDKRMYNIQMVKGDTLAFGVELDGIGQDLDNAQFICEETIRGTQLFQKTLGNGITKETAPEGAPADARFYKVRVAPADTAGIATGRYYYRFSVGANEDVFTLLLGVLDIV